MPENRKTIEHRAKKPPLKQHIYFSKASANAQK